MKEDLCLPEDIAPEPASSACEAGNWPSVCPSSSVERLNSRGVFLDISSVAGRFSDAVSFSWLDVAIPLALVLIIVFIQRRRWRWLLNLVAILYLIFFWSWGLNYHR